MKINIRNAVRFIIFLVITFSSPSVFALTNFISAPNRVDMIYDDARGTLYITSGTSVLRYKLATKSFLTPYTFNLGNLSGIDVSPDGNTLAIADRNITGIHLVDLQTDTIKPDIMFTPAYGEGGSFAVAYGNDGALLVTTRYNGSGGTPLRRVDPQTGTTTVIASSVYQMGMLSSSADGKCIAHVEDVSSGPLNLYDVTTQKITKTARTDWYNTEVGTNRNCTQFAVPTYGGTFIYDSNLSKLGTIGQYANGRPIGVAYHPTSDIAYFAWAGANQVWVYDTNTFAPLAVFNIGYTFQTTSGGYAFSEGRLKLSRDGSLLFAKVGNGISYISTSLAPVADDRSISVNTALPTPITLTGSTPKPLSLTYTVVSQPTHGTLQGTAPNLTYTPEATYSGQDSFTFKVSDGTLESTPATVTITIDKAPPVIETLILPATSSTLTVAVSGFSATDNVGVTGYCLSETGVSSACTWTDTPPASYRFGGIGSHTLYAFARDAAGNVSSPASATVDIPEIVPKITSFSIPPTYGYTNRTVPVTFTATDDLGVTGYCLTEVADPATCAWNSWAPTNYTFTTVGPHTLYAYARNNTGKVSAPSQASTTVVGDVNFIPASSRVDMVYDSVRDVVYITSGTSVLRYKIGTNTFLSPYQFGLGNLSGIDLSLDGNTLAVADKNFTGIHLIDLRNDTTRNITFPPSSGEGGTFSVAFGNDGTLLVTTQFNGSGWVPLRRVDPDTGTITVITVSPFNMISQNTMLSSSADGTCLGFAESNSSAGPVSIYDVATQKITKTVRTDWFAYEIGTNRNCTQFAVPLYGGTFIYDNSLTKIGTVGVYAGGQPIGVAYHPLSDIVYFAWVGTREVRAYDTKTFTQIGAFDFGYTFQSNGNYAYQNGRLKVSRDGALLFATIQNGVRYQRLNGNAPVADDQAVVSYADTPLPMSLTGNSPKNAPLTFTVVTQPAHGSLSGTTPNLTYTPDQNYAGQDTITFRVNDGTTDSNTATITITIKPGLSNVVINPPTVKGELTLTWTNPSDSNFSHIHIYRSTNAGALGALVADNLSATTYTNSGLASQTTYYYTVRFVDKSGNESTNTSQVFQTTLDATPPVTAPAPAAGTYASSQSVKLSCNDGAGSGCESTYYCLGSGCTPTTLYNGGNIVIDNTTDLRFFSKDNAANSETIKTAGYIIIGAPEIGTSPGSKDFGEIPLNLAATQIFTISNYGTAPLIASNPFSITGPDSSSFIIATGGLNPCASLTPIIPAGGSCTVVVIFSPSPGTKTASLHITSNAVNSPVLDVPLKGIGSDAPAFHDLVPADGSWTRNVNCPVSGTVTDVNGVQFLSVNGNPVTVSPAGAFSFTVALTEGANTITFFATDSVGNQRTVTHTVYLDTVNPQIALSTLADGSLTSNATVNVAGKVTDSGAIQSFTVNDTAVAVNQDGTFSHACQLIPGANPITVNAADLAGNLSSETRTIILDQQVPLLTVTAPADNSTTGRSFVEVTGTVDETSTVQLAVNNDAPQSAAMDGTGFAATVNLAPGINTIDITAADLAGNNASAKRTVTYDNQGPTLAITEPGQDITTDRQSLLLRGTVADALTAVTVTIDMDGTIHTPPVVDGAFEQQLTFDDEKSYPITVTATDEGGNAATAQRNVIYALGNIVINKGAPLTSSRIVSLDLKYAQGATQMQFLFDDLSWGGWQAFFPRKSVTLPAGDGVKTVSVRFKVKGGTVSGVYSDTIVLDTSRPAGSVVINGGAAATDSRQVTLALTAGDANGVSTMRFSTNGIYWSAWEPFAATRELTLPAGRGLKRVLVKFRDTAGNVSPVAADTIWFAP